MLVISGTVPEIIFGHCWWCLENMFLICFTSLIKVKRRSLKHHHNELYSQIPRFEMFRNLFQVLPKWDVLHFVLRYCLNMFLCMLKLQQPFSRGAPKRGNPTMTTSTVTARRKGDPQHYVEWKMNYMISKILLFGKINFGTLKIEISKNEFLLFYNFKN